MSPSVRLASRRTWTPTPGVSDLSSYHDKRVNQADSTAILDDVTPRPSKIVPIQREGGVRGSPVPGTSTVAAVIDDAEQENLPTGERSDPFYPRLFHADYVLSSIRREQHSH